MLTKRIIPCLDIKNGRTVKGVNFEQLRDAGDPIALAKLYSEQGADELVFLDITATHEKRKTLVSLVERIASNIDIPFTVGGGINHVDIASELILSGADKISVNSAAVTHPDLLGQIASKFGTQCLVLAVDAKQINGQWKVHLNGGKLPTEIDLFDWVLEAQNRGAGEILFTSMDHDGTKNGYALDALNKMNQMLMIPIIASGGAGEMSHFKDVFLQNAAEGALAASIFHFNEVMIPELKKYLYQNNIHVRL